MTNYRHRLFACVFIIALLLSGLFSAIAAPPDRASIDRENLKQNPATEISPRAIQLPATAEQPSVFTRNAATRELNAHSGVIMGNRRADTNTYSEPDFKVGWPSLN